MRQVYIGLDRSEEIAAKIAKESLLDHAKKPVNVTFLKVDRLRRAGLYTRHSYKHGEQHYDSVDHRPFSTEFSFTRFLVPTLAQWQGFALFVDGDVLFRDDVNKLFDQRAVPEFAISCVQHAYNPLEERKMRLGLKQEPYQRKNWTSVMLFNCEHPSLACLTPQFVNTVDGRFLQSLAWCPDVYLGELGKRWNYLCGDTASDVDAAVVHYTRGTPDIKGYEDEPYAEEWFRVYDKIEGQ